MAKGISESDIRPRENVFTYHAWRALGRQVRRGEHGVKVLTYVSIKGKEDKDGIATNDVDGTDKPKRGATRRPWTATVFHVSQTDPLQADPIGHAATRACENSGHVDPRLIRPKITSCGCTPIRGCPATCTTA